MGRGAKWRITLPRAGGNSKIGLTWASTLQFFRASHRPVDSSKRFHYGGGMAEYTLKNIPEEIYHRAQAAAENSLRSLNQEIIFRLRRSFDAEDARTSALHARWVMEALQSGPARPLQVADMDAAFAKGVSRAKARRKGK
jgi:hypothetical protein